MQSSLNPPVFIRACMIVHLKTSEFRNVDIEPLIDQRKGAEEIFQGLKGYYYSLNLPGGWGFGDRAVIAV